MASERDDGELDTFDESEALDASDIAVFVDEDGVEHAFAVLAVVEAAGGEFALATPLAQLDGEVEVDDFEVFVFRYRCDDDGTEHYEPVDDDSIFDEVRRAAENIVDFERGPRTVGPYTGPVGEA